MGTASLAKVVTGSNAAGGGEVVEKQRKQQPKQQQPPLQYQQRVRGQGLRTHQKMG